MNTSQYKLHFSQLTKAWRRSQLNNYSDSQKETYQNKLSELYDYLSTEDFNSLGENDIYERANILGFFIKSLEFLDNSTLNLIPFEIVECLKSALRDWVDDFDRYIIVTSPVNTSEGFSFDPILALNDQYFTSIRSISGIEFDYRLIQINIPRYVIRDYFVNVVLYHELGHFIDLKYNICRSVCSKIIIDYINGRLKVDELKDITTYFPNLPNPSQLLAIRQQFRVPYPPTFLYHMGEYFCDIFASQYIGETSGLYLRYLTQNGQASDSHPSTENRINIVNDFLNNRPGYLIKKLQEAVLLISNRGLKTRSKPIPQAEQDLLNLVPAIIQEDDQLHSIFSVGWNLWNSSYSLFKENNHIEFDLSEERVYTIINNLIEKSIGNHIIERDWQRQQLKQNVPS